MSIGPLQILLILAIVLILFGAGKLPNVMGDIAKGIKNFRAGIKESDGGDSQPPEGPTGKDKDPGESNKKLSGRS
ncbi:MAG: twin-arginine translocase TatA/TatE family subunit [Alphaproteobacteria bacterium]